MTVGTLQYYYCVLLCHAGSLISKKNAPGGDLIRVDLIRFPGSIPGDIKVSAN